jgi:hypothetical protein
VAFPRLAVDAASDLPDNLYQTKILLCPRDQGQERLAANTLPQQTPAIHPSQDHILRCAFVEISENDPEDDPRIQARRPFA